MLKTLSILLISTLKENLIFKYEKLKRSDQSTRLHSTAGAIRMILGRPWRRKWNTLGCDVT